MKEDFEVPADVVVKKLLDQNASMTLRLATLEAVIESLQAKLEKYENGENQT